MLNWLKKALKWLLNWDCFETPTMSKAEVIRKLEEHMATIEEGKLIELYRNCLFYLRRIPTLYRLKRRR